MKWLNVLLFFCFSMSVATAQQLSLKGTWNVKLDSEPDKTYAIKLPGTLDDAGIGEKLTATTGINIASMAHLSRKVQFTGKAYYSKTFTTPLSFKQKQIIVTLGRVLWKSTISIDGEQLAQTGESLIAAHQFDITDYIVAGKKQTITICIDNSNIYPGINIYASQYPSKESAEMAHAYTNHTQIKWNGILGDIILTAKPKVSVEKVGVYADMLSKNLTINYQLNNSNSKKLIVKSYVLDATTGKKWPVTFNNPAVTTTSLTASIPFASNVIYWSEFSPRQYLLVTTVTSDYGTDTNITKFGVREFKAANESFYLNDSRVFMRGNLECIIFPLTGYPPMQVQEWKKIFATAKSYGLNSFRFHSWCPPAVAFEAADELGFYLQVELPHWNLKVGEDTAAFSFLTREAHRILDAYGNHPSFLFFSMGNELEGDFKKLNDLVAELKQKDNRHLYSTTTFTFQKEITGKPQPQDDFYVTQWTKNGWIRGQGVFNDLSPDFSKDYSNNITDVKIPIVSHEIGQYSVFPDINEIEKYTGNLVAKNFTAVKEDLKKKGLLQFAPEYLNASGKFATILYKEEIERALKTKGFDGFQLLQMQDFPGQGTALVGLLNAFWQSKGVVTAKEFRKYCSEVTPLIRFPKPVYNNSEVFEADVELANFYKLLKNVEIAYTIKDENGLLYKTASFSKKDYVVDNGLPVGKIKFDLATVKAAKKLIVQVALKGTSYVNDWSIWVYPSNLKTDNGNVKVTASLSDAMTALQNGEKVLLCPLPDTLKGPKGKFVPVFWSPIHFPKDPGTMGLLIKAKHKALSDFHTDNYSNWQWWDLTTKSKAIIAAGLPDEANIIRPIDNFVTNNNLTSLFEVKVGKGKLMFCSIDIMTDLENRLQAKQLKYSLLNYMNSKDFNPATGLAAEQLAAFFKMP